MKMLPEYAEVQKKRTRNQKRKSARILRLRVFCGAGAEAQFFPDLTADFFRLISILDYSHYATRTTVADTYLRVPLLLFVQRYLGFVWLLAVQSIMLCLRCRAVPSAGLRLNPFQSVTSGMAQSSRPFSSAILSRLNTTTTTTTNTIRHTFPQTSTTSTMTPATTRTTPITSLASFTAPQQSRTFSASASLAGKRRTFNPSRRTQKRRHGFLARLRTREGRQILIRRRAKGKKALSW